MITARRIREARAREAAGLPPPAPPPPSVISYAQHQQEIGDLNMAHARELSALRRELSGGDADVVANLKADKAKLEARVKELEQLLEGATAPTRSHEGDTGQRSKKGSRSRG